VAENVKLAATTLAPDMIKKIHYCWFGGKMPANVAANVATWKRMNPDFELCEWNEGNSDVSAYAFGRRALEQKKWGFVSDIVRLQKLYSEGGVYLDTDVELIRPLEILAGEGDQFVLGYIFDCALGTAVLYSPARHPVVGKLLGEYHHVSAGVWPVNNTIFTDYFINHVPDYLLNGRRWKESAAKISIYPKEFFEQPAFVRQRGISIHHCSGSWMPKNTGTVLKVSAAGESPKLKWLKRKVRTFFAALRSEYRAVYWQALRGRRIPHASGWRENS
jgi:mannosyltransferase OCH1-like enzyme